LGLAPNLAGFGAGVGNVIGGLFGGFVDIALGISADFCRSASSLGTFFIGLVTRRCDIGLGFGG
jgi:hypothetical protein